MDLLMTLIVALGLLGTLAAIAGFESRDGIEHSGH
jgi:hypothetical protein